MKKLKEITHAEKNTACRGRKHTHTTINYARWGGGGKNQNCEKL